MNSLFRREYVRAHIASEGKAAIDGRAATRMPQKLGAGKVEVKMTPASHSWSCMEFWRCWRGFRLRIAEIWIDSMVIHVETGH